MPTPFRRANDLLVQYAAYHRDQRNIATHAVGIPLIVFAAGVLLARMQFELEQTRFNAAELLWMLTSAWYLTRGQFMLGLAVSLANGALFALALPFSEGGNGHWLAVGLGSFAVGWILQFIGHYYEGRKPAFIDDLVGLLVGPMFVAGEALFAAGFFRPLAEEIERRSGPTLLRDLAHPVG